MVENLTKRSKDSGAAKNSSKTAAAKSKPKPKTKTKARESKPRPLSFQQRLFVAEYLKDRNGTQAAIRAGYSAKTAGVQAYELLKNPQIQAQVEQFVSKAEEKVGLTIERTLQEVARLAFFDPRKLLNDDGSPKPIAELDDDTAACLAGLDIQEQFEGSGADRVFVGYVKKYKIADKNSALDKAMKHLGLFEKDNKQKVDPFAELLAQIQGTPLKPGT